MLNVVILLLVIIIIILSLIIYTFLNKFKFLSKSDIEIIDFIIDIYIDYGNKLDLYDEEKHKIIIKNLEKIKKNLK